MIVYKQKWNASLYNNACKEGIWDGYEAKYLKIFTNWYWFTRIHEDVFVLIFFTGLWWCIHTQVSGNTHTAIYIITGIQYNTYCTMNTHTHIQFSVNFINQKFV